MVGTRCVGVSRWSYLAPEAPGGKVLCGHKPQSKPHLSEPGTHQRTWRVMGRPARQKTQTPSMTRRNDRTRHDHAAAPLADCPFVPPFVPPSPTQKRAPRPKHPGTLPKLKYPITINRYQSSPNPKPKLLNLLLTGNPLDLRSKTPQLLFKVLIPTLDINNIINNRNTLSSQPRNNKRSRNF